MGRFTETVGEVLRATRRERGLTLHDVRRRSGGRFKPSVVGGYERGERGISLERLCGIAGVYGVPADRLLADVLRRLAPEGRREVVIDLNRISRLQTEEGRLVAEFVHRVRAQRGDYLTDVVTLRAGDLEALALASRLRPANLLQKLVPAVRKPRAR